MNNKPKQIEYYHSLLEKHGDHYLSLDWKNPESQGIRFKVFEDLLTIGNKSPHQKFWCGDERNDFSILDVGCGFGDFYGYLKKAGYKFQYAGYDIAPKIIESARKKYPEARFEVRDILDDKKPEKFDFVFCCGALNISFDNREAHLDFIRSMLLRMFELCNIGVGVNFLSSQAIYHLPDDSFREPQYFYSKPEEIIGFVKGITNRFLLRHDYHPADFTVYLLK
ncbi:MAG: class I SAM-dependent methyltransferase [Candidatus Margulisiibacteriota bacterium]